MTATVRAAALCAAFVASAAAATPATDLAAVRAHLAAVHTMTADFTQTDRNGRTLSGTVQLRRPGHIRFQYQKGVPLLIVGDGRALTMIDYQVRQVSRWPIGDTPLALLLDPSRALPATARVLPSPDAQTILVEGRDPKHREYGTITVAFRRDPAAPGGLTPAGWTVIDGQNNRTTTRLDHQRFDVPIADDAFRWTDPRPRR